ncbi:MAG: hypothetical protein AVDCRST_MAG52-1879, partial [uncultured Blastococcus sp.]
GRGAPGCRRPAHPHGVGRPPGRSHPLAGRRRDRRRPRCAAGRRRGHPGRQRPAGPRTRPGRHRPGPAGPDRGRCRHRCPPPHQALAGGARRHPLADGTPAHRRPGDHRVRAGGLRRARSDPGAGAPAAAEHRGLAHPCRPGARRRRGARRARGRGPVGAHRRGAAHALRREGRPPL